MWCEDWNSNLDLPSPGHFEIGESLSDEKQAVASNTIKLSIRNILLCW